jgi:hypothetical protein
LLIGIVLFLQAVALGKTTGWGAVALELEDLRELGHGLPDYL